MFDAADRESLFQNSLYIYESKDPFLFDENAENALAYIVAKVVSERDKVTRDAIMRAVDAGKIQTAIIINQETIENAFKMLEPMPVFGARCMRCGNEVYKYLNPKYCGHCGQKIEWGTR